MTVITISSPIKASALLASKHIAHPHKALPHLPWSPSSDYLLLCPFTAKLLTKNELCSLFFTAFSFICFWRHSNQAVFSTETSCQYLDIFKSNGKDLVLILPQHHLMQLLIFYSFKFFNCLWDVLALGSPMLTLFPHSSLLVPLYFST